MVTSADVRGWLEGFDALGDQRAADSRTATLALLDLHSRPGTRTRFDPGHVTASGLVLSPDGSVVLLVFHTRLGRWLQPGGHLESTDASVVDAARREVLEETGVAVDGRVAPLLVGVDVHEIPSAHGEPTHRHHDLMFRFVAAGQALEPGAGVLRAAWCPVDRLDDFGVDEPLRRAVARALTSPAAPVSGS